MYIQQVMNDLTAEQQYFIARRLGLFESYSEIIANFYLHFNKTLLPPDIARCDPTRGHVTDPMVRAVFDAAQAQFLASPYACPPAARQVRLAMLYRYLKEYEERNQIGECRATLAQIADEVNNEKVESNRENAASMPMANAGGSTLTFRIVRSENAVQP